MSDEVGSPEPLLEHPPALRSKMIPALSNNRLSTHWRDSEIRLSRVVLASGIALAVEGLRLAARANRKRAAARQVESGPEQISVTYKWTHVTYERYERF
jgi:hypothetical protein